MIKYKMDLRNPVKRLKLCRRVDSRSFRVDSRSFRVDSKSFRVDSLRVYSTMCLVIHYRVDSEKVRVVSLRARQYEWPEWEVPEPTPPQWESSPKFGSRLQYCRVVSLRASQKLEVCSLLCRVVSALSRVVSQVWESSPQELESSPEFWKRTVTASFWILTAISFFNCHICVPNGYIADGKYIRTYIQWEE